VRRGQKVRGPYPQGQIVREALLGRIRPEDELSHDHEHWQPLSALPELHPEKIFKAGTPEGQQRLRMAKLHEDERARDRRGTRKSAGTERRGPDRRKKEPEEIVRHRQKIRRWSAEKSAQEMKPRLAYMVLAGVVLALVIYFVGYRPAAPSGERNCNAPPAPGVNWSSCRLSGQMLNREDLSRARLDSAQLRRVHLQGTILTGADLRYADLEGSLLQQADLRAATLTGAVLRGATLERADLRGADLRFANFVNANLDGARLGEARLDKAIWTNGRICAVNSVGSCQ
jgi:hypothetical protein